MVFKTLNIQRLQLIDSQWSILLFQFGFQIVDQKYQRSIVLILVLAQRLQQFTHIVIVIDTYIDVLVYFIFRNVLQKHRLFIGVYFDLLMFFLFLQKLIDLFLAIIVFQIHLDI